MVSCQLHQAGTGVGPSVPGFGGTFCWDAWPCLYEAVSPRAPARAAAMQASGEDAGQALTGPPASLWVVALNYQTEGRMLQLNRAKFSANGNCGYVLKPPCMCHGKALGAWGHGWGCTRTRGSLGRATGWITLGCSEGPLLCQEGSGGELGGPTHRLTWSVVWAHPL